MRLVLTLFVSMAVANCNHHVNRTDNNLLPDTHVLQKTHTPIVDSSNPVEPDFPTLQPETFWYYTDKVVDGQKGKAHFARLQANDKLLLDSSKSKLTVELQIRQMRGEDQVILVFSKGMLFSDGPKNLKMRFDDKPPRTYTCSFLSDNKYSYLFIDSSLNLIHRLKKSSKFDVVVDFDSYGSKVVNFYVVGLVWGS